MLEINDVMTTFIELVVCWPEVAGLVHHGMPGVGCVWLSNSENVKTNADEQTERHACK
jgi:hypothetical protein